MQIIAPAFLLEKTISKMIIIRDKTIEINPKIIKQNIFWDIRCLIIKAKSEDSTEGKILLFYFRGSSR